MRMLMVWTGMLLIALVQAPMLINRKQWQELAAFIFFWLAAGIYASVVLGTYAGDIAVSNHTELLDRFFSALYQRLGME